ncbi:MAG: single-stranded DNA-binding protein [Acidobacteriaceae bacterium]|jgi:single-strand DNA-binding protein|nr:single-stranded DNA-binding protein [Acidobacteriaceae bacterium]
MAKGTINKVTILGNLGDEPEIRYTANKGTPVATLSIATTERFKNSETGEYNERTEWHHVIMWAGLADLAKQYLHKGSKIYIEGRLQSRLWKDKETGQNRCALDIIVTDLEMLGGPRTTEESETYGGAHSGPLDEESAI